MYRLLLFFCTRSSSKLQVSRVRHHHHHHHHNSNTKEEEKGLSQASRRYSYNNNTGESSWLDASSDEEDNENANPTESTDSSYRSSTDHDRFHLRRICYLLRTKKLLSTNPTVYDWSPQDLLRLKS